MIIERIAELSARESTRRGGQSLAHARALCACILEAYWKAIQSDYSRKWKISRPLSAPDWRLNLPVVVVEECCELGKSLGQLPVLDAGYELGRTYASLIPAAMRAEYGVYYTPPAIAGRLLTLAEEAGVDWKHATMLDPACGGGAFVAAMAQWLKVNLKSLDEAGLITEVAQRVRGYEIDPFSAWMSQVFAEAVLLHECRAVSRRLPRVVEIRDSLAEDAPLGNFDLVIGNPPYGRTKLGNRDRERFKRGIFGHANLYGVFTDQALRLAEHNGVIAFVTPTSILSGEYFKKLRGLLAAVAPPRHIEFVSDRKGVFDGVLQETMLSTFRKGEGSGQGSVGGVSVSDGDEAPAVCRWGAFELPLDGTAPWALPRNRRDVRLLSKAAKCRMALGNYGFRVKTGPLVWNRHKSSLTDSESSHTLPIVWAESVLPAGSFELRSEKRNHKPCIEIQEAQDWLVTREACVLLQRTTAKEQRRRLICAVLPNSFFNQHAGAAIENHLNMVVPVEGKPSLGFETLCAYLNSEVADRLFRCLSGSVAVSAFELEALPMPGPRTMKSLAELVRKGESREGIDRFLSAHY